MPINRDLITSVALGELLASGDGGKPTPEQLDKYFRSTGLWNSYKDADKHSKNNWCGFFACYCLRTATLLNVRWMPGIGLVGPVKKVEGYRGIQIGDVAILAHDSHHIIITQVGAGFIADVEGNGEPPENMRYLGGVITTGHRGISKITGYYQIQG